MTRWRWPTARRWQGRARFYVSRASLVLPAGDVDALMVPYACEVAALEALQRAAVVRLRHVAARRAGAWVPATWPAS